MSSYNFKTEYFGLKDDHLFLLRSGFPIQKIPFNQISRIFISRGVVTKFPIRSFLFGLILLIVSLLIFLPFPEFLFEHASEGFIDDPDMPGSDSHYFAKGFGAWIIMIGFLAAIGIVAISHSLKKTLVMKVHHKDGFEVFSLSDFVKNNEILELIDFMEESFPNRFSNKSRYEKSLNV